VSQVGSRITGYSEVMPSGRVGVLSETAQHPMARGRSQAEAILDTHKNGHYAAQPRCRCPRRHAHALERDVPIPKEFL
jgi:hypothetical protein